ncbi:GNAT family N-acetyltransferase [Devosia ginsengisoli]|uniref:GNAT family N-acetyltransferase n=1 Tax=Devosia ginsengisoli TaxID=400770 RepID=UPI0026EC487D|nr:GNAT family N-acetyltransferase [Devosia ginsengisoli]MCR6671518.1 GNAT family N-acetyltransferase [Devosia ginsengisoli]
MPGYSEKLDPTQGDIDNVLAAIVASEEGSGRMAGYQPYSILLSDDDGQPVIGGLYGYQLFDWLFIQYLGVPASMQGKGVGQELMARAEAWARGRGLAGMWLDTFAFQARPFYEKLGFSVFGEIEDHPRGSSRYFLNKRF